MIAIRMTPEQRQAARERCESPVGWAGRTDLLAALDALDEADRRIQIGKDNCAALLGFMGQKDDLLEKAATRIAELEADRAGTPTIPAELLEAWSDLFAHIGDDQGFIVGPGVSECQTCGKRAGQISAIDHDDGCFTAAVQRMQRVIDAMKPEGR